MAEIPQVSIIVPTINEVENIESLVSRVISATAGTGISVEIIIVDDGSTDGTREAILGLGDNFPVRLIARPYRMGITSAVLEGFRNASAPVLGAMDSDLSHPPERIPELVRPIIDGGYDMTIGSRYVEGGSTRNWPLKRRLVSRVAGTLARPLTGVRDPMSGFFFVRDDIVKPLELSSRGWKICLEILARARPGRVKEVPIDFVDRAAGSSKMGAGTVLGFLINLLDLYLCRFFGSSLEAMVRFCAVGGVGVLLNLIILTFLVDVVGLWYMLAATITFFVVALNNFTWNKLWTFRDRRRSPLVLSKQLLKFIVASTVALGINLGVLYTMVEYFGLWYILGQLFSICVAVIANFSLNALWVFR